MTQEEKAKAYDEVRKKIAIRFGSNVADEIFSQFEMSEDEKIRKEIMGFIFNYPQKLTNRDSWLAWLEKESNTNEIVNKKKIAPDILRGAAINLITWIDYNVAEGNMCLSNIECKRIEDALVNGDWGKIYAYMKKKLEKQGKKDAITFNDAHIIDSALNDYCCKQYNALHKENGGVLSFARLQHLAMDIYGWCKKQNEQNLANSAKTCKDEQKPDDKVEPKSKLAANTVRYKEEGSIEYTRTEAFIEKARKWFENQPEHYDANGVRVYGEEDFEDFVNYMRGE